MIRDYRTIVHLAVPMLRECVEGPYGIAIGGAHAKGAADAESDLDLYVFAERIRRDDERTSLALGRGARSAVSWSVGDPFEQAGTDFYVGDLKVECWFRSISLIEGTIQECRAGIVRRSFVTWTPNGFYNHCCLSDLKAMVPVGDPEGVLASWKRAVAVYPPALRSAIVRQHLAAARFWPHNFHYSSAVERQDLLYTSAIVQQVVHNLVQVLFAVNETYFPGDKKLAAAVDQLPAMPARFAGRAADLLLPGVRPTVEMLRSQQRDLQALVADVEVLAGSSEAG